MPGINQDLVARASEVQNDIWAQVGTAATEAFGTDVKFDSPLTVISRVEDIQADATGPMLVLHFGFTSSPENHQIILISPDVAKMLISTLRGGEDADLGEEVLTEVRPAFQSIAQAICGAAATHTGESIALTNFDMQLQILELPPKLEEADELLRVQVSLTTGEQTGTIAWLIDEETAAHLTGFAPGDGHLEEGRDAERSGGMGRPAELDILLDIPLQVSVELGRVNMLVQDVVEIGAGSVIEIDKAAGDPVDVLVNGRLVAHGEVVVIEDNFGVRITEILSPQERVHKLGENAA